MLVKKHNNIKYIINEKSKKNNVLSNFKYIYITI